MTVSELIEKLKDFPPDLEVAYFEEIGPYYMPGYGYETFDYAELRLITDEVLADENDRWGDKLEVTDRIKNRPFLGIHCL